MNINELIEALEDNIKTCDEQMLALKEEKKNYKAKLKKLEKMSKDLADLYV